MPAKDQLNRPAVEALMVSRGIDGYADLARRMERAARDLGLHRTFERSFVSRVMRDDRTAQPSFIVCAATAVGVPTVAITGEGIDISLADLEAVPA